jgi:N-acyl-D-aspartate/D-glutamate deacylase
MAVSSRPRGRAPAAAVDISWWRDLALAATLALIVGVVPSGAAGELFSGPDLAQKARTEARNAPEEPTNPASQGGSNVTPPKVSEDFSPPGAGHVFDVVISGGRVMDPGSGFDRVANVGVDGKRITKISTDRLKGKRTIDASGLVVAPGFIDILSYDPNDYGAWFKIADGVTTNLLMHGGTTVSAAEWFSRWEGNTPVHIGGAFDASLAREGLGIGTTEEASGAQIQQLVETARRTLDEGWIGVHFQPEYSPGTTYEEIREISQVAADKKVPVFFHARYSDMERPGTNVEALEEVLRTARDTGASVHVEHINSTGGTFSMEQSLQTLQEARADGIDVTACVYPYNFWATYLGSNRFAPGWQERFRIGYNDLVIPGTGERLTESSFARYQAENVLAAAFAIPEKDVQTALESEFVMMGSDAILEPDGNNHPRAAGTFSRVLGKYVREEQLISLMDALAKMTIMPARRLQEQAPAMRTKGRMQMGADADITIFDPATVIDKATVTNPAQESVGIEWVLVMGRVAKDPRGLHRDVMAGQAIKSDFN